MLDLAAVSLLAIALNRDAPMTQTYGPQPTPVHRAASSEPVGVGGKPGVIRPAYGVTDWKKRDDDHRGFACADNDCKVTTPVYNTLTPLEQEQGRLGAG